MIKILILYSLVFVAVAHGAPAQDQHGDAGFVSPDGTYKVDVVKPKNYNESNDDGTRVLVVEKKATQ